MSTLPKRARPITVQGRSFRWMTGQGRGHLYKRSGPGLTLTVQAEGSSAVLQVRLQSIPYTKQEEYAEEYVGVKTALTPKDVAVIIELALQKGWDPSTAWSEQLGPLQLGDYQIV